MYVMSIADIDLFRSVRFEQFPNGTIVDDKPAIGVLYPDFEPRRLNNGKLRPADVVSSKDKSMVISGGTSFFDRDRVFKSKDWLSFKIPEGTIIPDSLIIRFTGHNPTFKANHYQIECSTNMMQVVSYKGALDNLARNAVFRSIELANR